MLKNNCLFKQEDGFKTEHFRTYNLTGTGFILLNHVLTRVFLRFLKSLNIIAQVSWTHPARAADGNQHAEGVHLLTNQDVVKNLRYCMSVWLWQVRRSLPDTFLEVMC